MQILFILIPDEDGTILLPDLDDYMDKDLENEGLVLTFPDIQKR